MSYIIFVSYRHYNEVMMQTQETHLPLSHYELMSSEDEAEKIKIMIAVYYDLI